ncbi:XRE family transcriptional regulator [Peptoniphilus sp. MSJ-1]|uniref:XRE family transcriptional regulator n=1 Tax=Peptoniphilus ovalis TaxID=2841503 RepID=A0ABS6FH07_9FIRM|nr:XRE family transcriptional regulator [Peptoniphilus ovalis]MBU5669456.1 XRE family transcriptional regulator [Peptoniphilus ovalis]
MEIGSKIKELRIEKGLTQEELADRSELTKGFISQIERDLTSPSVDSLLDILEALGTEPGIFFEKDKNEKIVFKEEDYFETDNDDLNYALEWIVPNAQKNQMEPTRIKIAPGGKSKVIPPYEGEEFGYVIKGSIVLIYGDNEYKVKKGETFYFEAKKSHCLVNKSSKDAEILWVSSPPSF